MFPNPLLQKLEENNKTYSGRGRGVCLMAEAKISLLKFSPGFRVKSCRDTKQKSLPSFAFSVALYSPPDLFFLCCSFGVWRLEIRGP